MFSNAGGIRPDQDAPPMMIAMDDPTHRLRRKLVNAGFTGRRVKDRQETMPVVFTPSALVGTR
jgi:cytochrome P450 family 142 subfamily A polypeptide 1